MTGAETEGFESGTEQSLFPGLPSAGRHAAPDLVSVERRDLLLVLEAVRSINGLLPGLQQEAASRLAQAAGVAS
jgi:hypothetical protein